VRVRAAGAKEMHTRVGDNPPGKGNGKFKTQKGRQKVLLYSSVQKVGYEATMRHMPLGRQDPETGGEGRD